MSHHQPHRLRGVRHPRARTGRRRNAWRGFHRLRRNHRGTALSPCPASARLRASGIALRGRRRGRRRHRAVSSSKSTSFSLFSSLAARGLLPASALRASPGDFLRRRARDIIARASIPLDGAGSACGDLLRGQLFIRADHRRMLMLWYPQYASGGGRPAAQLARRVRRAIDVALGQPQGLVAESLLRRLLPTAGNTPSQSSARICCQTTRSPSSPAGIGIQAQAHRTDEDAIFSDHGDHVAGGIAVFSGVREQPRHAVLRCR